MALKRVMVAGFLLLWVCVAMAVDEADDVVALLPGGPLSGRISASSASLGVFDTKPPPSTSRKQELKEELESLGVIVSPKADPKQVMSTLEKARLEVKATYAKTISRLLELEKKYVPKPLRGKDKKKKGEAKGKKTKGEGKGKGKGKAKSIEKDKCNHLKGKAKGKCKVLKRKGKNAAEKYVSPTYTSTTTCFI